MQVAVVVVVAPAWAARLEPALVGLAGVEMEPRPQVQSPKTEHLILGAGVVVKVEPTALAHLVLEATAAPAS